MTHHPMFTSLLVPNVLEAVYLINHNGVIRFATPIAAQLYGYRASQMVGRSALRFVAPEGREAIVAEWLDFYANMNRHYAEFTAPLLTADGHRTHIRSSIWRVPGKQEFVLMHHIMDRMQERLDTLYAIMAAASGTLELTRVMDIVLHEAERLIPSERAKLFIFDDQGRVSMVHTLAEGYRDYDPEKLGELSGFPTLRSIYATGQVVIIDDAEQDERWVTSANGNPVRSWLGAPLLVKSKVIGVLSLQSPDPGIFSHDDAALALALAAQVANAIQNARLYRAERERVQRYQVLNDISQAISFLNLNGMLEIVYHKLRELMDTTIFFIGLYDAEADTITVCGSYENGKKLPNITIASDYGLTGEVLQSCEERIIHDTQSEPIPSSAVIQGLMPRSLVMLPLLAQDQVVGVLSVQSSHPYAYTIEDIALLQTIAGVVATATRNARLHDQTVERLDALEMLHHTGLRSSASDDISEIAEQTIHAVMALFKPIQARLSLWDEWQPDDTPPLTWVAQPSFTQGPLQIRQEPDYEPLTVMQQVRSQGQPVILPDLKTYPVLQAEFATPWFVQALIAMPLKHGERQIGAIKLLFGEPQFFRRDMLRSLELLCLQAAAALANAQQKIVLRRRLDEVSALQDLGRRISSLENLDELMATVVNMLRDTYHCRSVSLALLDQVSGLVITRAAAGLDEHLIAEARFALGEPVVGLVVASGSPVYVPDIRQETPFRMIDPEVRCLMSVPLTVHNRVIGALSIDSIQPGAFSPEEGRVLMIAGGQIAAAIETVRLLAETRERAEQLAQANAELHTIDNLRKDLVNQVSHDLRSPLSIVYGYAGLLRDSEAGPITDEQREMLDLIVQRTQAIERMTVDILSTRQISRELLELAPLDLTQMCNQALIDARMVYHDRGITFGGDLLEQPLPIEGDINRLSRVFDNLIGNAVKFSPEGGTITIATHCSDDGREVRVSITDQGIGIAPSKLPYIFERFFQGDLSIKKRFGGTGLGLYIVKLIVEAHLGRVWVASCEGEGSTFTFALPLAQN